MWCNASRNRRYMCNSKQSSIGDKTELNRGVCLFLYLYRHSGFTTLYFDVFPTPPRSITSLMLLEWKVSLLHGASASVVSSPLADTVHLQHKLVNQTSVCFRGSEGFVANGHLGRFDAYSSGDSVGFQGEVAKLSHFFI